MNRNKENDLDKLRHSCSHIMADAVKRIFPEAKLGIGPAIQDGFYYDFDVPQGIKEEDLKAIEKQMKKIVKKNYLFEQDEWPSKDAEQFFSEKGETYKIELIKDLNQEKVSIYKHNGFVDLCKGPHVKSTAQLKNFKLLSVAGAYWKGSEKNSQMTRIYGTVFSNKEELEKYLNNRKEARERDHRKLGPELRLFDIYQEEAGPGLVFYLEKGAIVRRIIENWEINEHLKRGYQFINTPHMLESKLWEKSGHIDYYRDFMYMIESDEESSYAVKPMNCPGHMLVYKSKTRSYRDLPLRLFELGTVYRREKSGVLQGLLRLRGFTQDDAHIFCREHQLQAEIGGVLDFIKETMHKFQFNDFEAELSTRPDNSIGEKEKWEKAQDILKDILEDKGFNYKIGEKEGAFYGPKIDVRLKDALGRRWQCATVQLDFFLPSRFSLYYINEKGEKETPIMIHRVILGSFERFFATLIEHYKGAFPFWLAPVQVKVLSIKDKSAAYAEKVRNSLSDKFRVDIDLRDETLSKKIREAELEKVPFIAVVGESEQEKGTVNVRTHGRKQLGNMKIEEFIERIKDISGSFLNNVSNFL